MKVRELRDGLRSAAGAYQKATGQELTVSQLVEMLNDLPQQNASLSSVSLWSVVSSAAVKS